MNRVRQPFNVNNLAIAGALARAGRRRVPCNASYELNRAAWRRSSLALEKNGAFEYIPSYGNFVTFKGAGDGAAVNQKLLKQGVIVRPIGGYGLPEWLRVTIGTESENARFIEALAKALWNHGLSRAGDRPVFGLGLIGGSFSHVFQ